MPIPAVGQIDSIAAGGAGVVRIDGLVVFVPRTAPGDVAEFAYVTGKHLGQGRLGRVLKPSPVRVAPRCVHYDGDRCGGCQLQHLAYDAQLEAKRGIVRDALTRIARRTVDIPPVVPSPDQWQYRNKLTLALRRDGAKWRGGLHRWDDVDEVFSLRECPITHPRIVAGWRVILAAADALPRAAELRGALRLPAGNEGGLAFVLEGGRTWHRLQSFVDRCPELEIIRWHPEGATPRVVLDRAAHDTPAASFAQVNPAVATLVRSRVVERARAADPATAIDGYAGIGVIAAELARAGITVTAIESDREATLAAARLLPAGSRVIHGRVEDVLPRLLPADVVVLNPPRAGVEPQVCAALTNVRQRPRAVIYVSCNPATLARDVARLTGYRVALVEAFDMFPQTAHVETVCELVPESA